MTAPLSLADRISRREAQRLAKQASYHARAAAYFRTHGEDGKAELSEQWLTTHVRCRCCGRALYNDESKRLGIGPECRKGK